MVQLHVVEKRKLARRIDKDEHIWESGWWKMTEERARTLVGGDLYMHSQKAKASYFGGVITGYRVEDAGEHAGRIVFIFKADLEHKDVGTAREGWGMEMKFVQ